MAERTGSALGKVNSTVSSTENSAVSELRDGGKRYYRIGEVSRITGVKAYVLRYWESEFRWMMPAKSRSKQRMYRQKDIETILLIKKLLYDERFTIAGAKKRLKELDREREVGQLLLEMEGDPLERVNKIRKELEAIRSLL